MKRICFLKGRCLLGCYAPILPVRLSIAKHLIMACGKAKLLKSVTILECTV